MWRECQKTKKNKKYINLGENGNKTKQTSETCGENGKKQQQNKTKNKQKKKSVKM